MYHANIGYSFQFLKEIFCICNFVKGLYFSIGHFFLKYCISRDLKWRSGKIIYKCLEVKQEDGQGWEVALAKKGMRRTRRRKELNCYVVFFFCFKFLIFYFIYIMKFILLNLFWKAKILI